MKYYTLISQYKKGDQWVIEFGDSDNECVKDEMDCLKESYDPAFKYKIICTDNKQSAVNAKVAELNSKL